MEPQPVQSDRDLHRTANLVFAVTAALAFLPLIAAWLHAGLQSRRRSRPVEDEAGIDGHVEATHRGSLPRITDPAAGSPRHEWPFMSWVALLPDRLLRAAAYGFQGDSRFCSSTPLKETMRAGLLVAKSIWTRRVGALASLPQSEVM